MATRRSDRQMLNNWVSKASQKEKSTLATAIVVDENTDVEQFKESSKGHAKKKTELGGSDKKGKRKAVPESVDQEEVKEKKHKKGKKEKEEQTEEEVRKKKKDDKPQTASPVKVSEGDKADKGKEIAAETPKKKKKTEKEKKKAEKGKGIAGESSAKGSGNKVTSPDSIGKKSDLPSTWFRSHANQLSWKEKFASKPIAFCHLLDLDLVKKLELDCMKRLKKSSLWNVINPGSQAYPRLTRLFYLNLEVVDGEKIKLRSRVAGVDILLDHAVFSKVLGCPKSFNTDDHPDRKEALNQARSEFFLPNHPSTSSNKQLTHSVFNVQAKILFTILMRSILPKENSRELLSDRVLYTMFLVMNKYEVDMPTLVMDHMYYSSTQTRNHTLPYANLLPKFFEFFGISVEGEERYEVEVGKINEVTLQRLGIVQTVDKEWKFLVEVPSAEVKNKKFVKAKALTQALGSTSQNSSPQVMDKLELLELDLDEVKRGQLEISTEVKRMNKMLTRLTSRMMKYTDHLNILETSNEETQHKSQEAPQPSATPRTSLGENLHLDLNRTAIPQEDNEDSGDSETVLAEPAQQNEQVRSEDLFEDAGAQNEGQEGDAEGQEDDDEAAGLMNVDEAVLAEDEAAEEMEQENEEEDEVETEEEEEDGEDTSDED